MYFCANKSPRTLSENIYERLKVSGFDTVPFKGARRPFDHYRPDETSWYIVPSAALPFFKFGKLYFEWSKVPGTINAGFIFTKGLAQELAIVYPSKKGRRLIMEDDTWAFYHLHEFIREQKLFAALTEINSQLPDAPLQMRFHGSYIDDPGLFDPYAEEKKLFDEYEIAVDCTAGKLKTVRAVRQAMNLKILNQATDFKNFTTAFDKIAADKFLWCDIFIGTTFQIAQNDETVISVEDMIHKLFSPLQNLIV